jgi:hypothetical protein|nr:MAG TPA: hypothetical protein [Caudoviricetes sp.]
MGVNPQGIWTYSDADIVQSWPAFMNLGFNSVSDVIKSIQQNRLLVAKSINDQRDKIAAINKATTGSYDLLVYRSDLNEMYLATNTGIKKIWGGAPDIKYINDNEAFSQWRRYTQHGASAVISRNVSIPSQGLWLFSNCITLDNNDSSKDTNVDVFQSIGDGVFYNVGTTNTYNHSEGVLSFRMATMAYYAAGPRSVPVQVKISCSPVNNIGWGGLCIGATKIG